MSKGERLAYFTLYFFCLGYATLLLFAGNYFQAGVEFFFACGASFFLRLDTPAKGKNLTITIEIPKGATIEVSSFGSGGGGGVFGYQCSRGGSQTFGNGHKFEQDTSRPFGFKCVKCGFETGAGGSGGSAKVCDKKLSKLPPAGPMSEGEYKAWCDMHEIKDKK